VAAEIMFAKHPADARAFITVKSRHRSSWLEPNGGDRILVDRTGEGVPRRAVSAFEPIHPLICAAKSVLPGTRALRCRRPLEGHWMGWVGQKGEEQGMTSETRSS